VRRGFTLVEVLVALVVAAFATLMMHRIWSQLTDGATRLERAEAAFTSDQVGLRRLRDALGSMEAGIDSSSPFAGSSRQLSCATWVVLPGGWAGRTAFSLALVDSALVGHTRLGAVPLVRSVAAVRFSYLLGNGINTAWVSNWESPVTVPAAVRIELLRSFPGDPVTDTIVVAIGARG
jgi:prepilin-type N-terminal cleavage/methylation domain-containing protein